MLTVKRGLPLSRLLLQKETNTKTSLKLLEESASPQQRGEKVEVKVEKKGEEIEMHKVKEEKEEENYPKEKVSTGGSTILRRGALKLVMISHLPNLTHTALVFLPSQFLLRHFSPQPSFLYFQLHSLARCLVPTGDFVGVAMHGVLSSPCG